MYAPEIAVPHPTSSHLSTSLIPTTTLLPTPLSTHTPSATPSPSSRILTTNHGQGSLMTHTQSSSCDRSCTIAAAIIIPIFFLIILVGWAWYVLKVGRKRRVEKEIEMRKIGGEEGEEEWGEGKRESGVGGEGDGAVVREVEVVEGREGEGEGEGEPVDGKAGKGWTRWWTR